MANLYEMIGGIPEGIGDLLFGGAEKEAARAQGRAAREGAGTMAEMLGYAKEVADPRRALSDQALKDMMSLAGRGPQAPELES